VNRLSIAAEFRDNETAQHIRRMSHYCALLAAKTGMDREKTDLIRVASQMHDVGKIGIPDSILLKNGRLTPQERIVIEQHPGIGHRILRGSTSELLQIAATIALSHHERIDGAGYPNKIKGDDIPIEARVAAIADVFDALTTNRVYRGAFHLQEAVDIMKEGRGTQFDADLLDLFLESLSEVLEIKGELESEVILPLFPDQAV
jgi:putative two-component system response regulator